MRSTVPGSVVLALLILLVGDAPGADQQDFAYRIGCASADITGPMVGVQFWGFVRADQVGNGLHLRQRARVFLIEEPQENRRLAIVVCDLGSITHELHQEVVDRLQKTFGDRYSLSNVIISATHTHAAPGGFWHAGVGTPFGSPLYGQYFHHIVDGIVRSIETAHQSAEPGNILIAQGAVPDAGRNRSLVAYMNNPEDERARYNSDTDTTMTLLRFETADGPIGCLNWFAVHPTTMTYNNKLISGDNKGYAEVAFERHVPSHDPSQPIVAAFAQSNCGDVTGNLNLDNTGPGEDEFETTRIIGERQYVIARELFDQAADRLSGPLDSRHAFVDFSSVPLSDEFTQQGDQSTAAAAYGYAFAAGSTEDGGGHPLFREGMTQTAPLLEMTLDQQFPDARPDDALREQHQPKAILIAPGNMPPEAGLSQTLSLTVARIGPLLLAAGPAEFTTMAGRRIRDSLADATGLQSEHVVIAGYANGYAGYVTTREEYETQQYEGGHTLFGPWTLAAYQQEYVRLGSALAKGRPLETGSPAVTDLRGDVPDTRLGNEADVFPEDIAPAAQITAPQETYRRGETASAVFQTSNPQNHYPHAEFAARVEFQRDSQWELVATEADWSTKCVFNRSRSAARPFEVTIAWDIPNDAVPGRYRLRHSCAVTTDPETDANVFDGTSSAFLVVE